MKTGGARGLVVGVDVGGTFTDVIALHGSRRSVRKTPSRPDSPGDDVLEGLRQVGQDLGFLTLDSLLEHTALIFHGSTVATNILLTLSGAPVGLITTEGFGDVVEMRGGIRENTFDSHMANAVPLAPRHLRSEASEETDRDGHVLHRVRPDQVRELTRALRGGGAGSVAIAFKHSHANGENERLAAEIVRSEWPDVYLTVSSDLLSRARLYDRVSSAVVNSYVGLATTRYLAELRQRLAALGFDGQLLVMSGNGGVITVDEAVARPASLLLSGPSAGPTAGRHLLAAAGYGDGVIVDMGGTSFDVSLLRDGQVHLADRSDIGRYRVALPMLEIHTIGAGGGSIARIDDVGLVRVGPESAGALPGPACYGLGGLLPTVTDANVVLGLLPPGAILGGSRRLDEGAARESIARTIADPLAVTAEEAAWGIHAVASANMAAAIREMTMGKGVDPRGLPLVVGGGAGALHAAAIAASLGFSDVLVPWDAGVLCALGMVGSDVRYDKTVSIVKVVDEHTGAVLRAMVEDAKARLARRLDPLSDLIAGSEYVVECQLRYQGQFHELTVPVPEGDLREDAARAVCARFAEAHLRAYGFAVGDAPVELVNLRVTIVGRIHRDGDDPADHARATLRRTGSRRIFLGAHPAVDADVFIPGAPAEEPSAVSIAGPAVIDLPTTTVLVPPGWTARAAAAALHLMPTNEVGRA